MNKNSLDQNNKINILNKKFKKENYEKKNNLSKPLNVMPFQILLEIFNGPPIDHQI